MGENEGKEGGKGERKWRKGGMKMRKEGRKMRKEVRKKEGQEREKGGEEECFQERLFRCERILSVPLPQEKEE